MATNKKSTKKVAAARGPNIRWTPEEKQQVAQEAARATHSGGISSPLQALHAGQAVLSEDRKRPSIHTVGDKSGDAWFRPAYTKELAKLRDEVKETATPRPVPADLIEAPRLNGNALKSMKGQPVATEIGQAFLNLRAMLVDELASVFVEAALKAISSTPFGGPQGVSQRLPKVGKPGTLAAH